MQRWKQYMASTEADRHQAEVAPAHEQPAPEPADSEFIGAPWFPDCEPFPRTT
jgi:hypothetical protein